MIVHDLIQAACSLYGSLVALFALCAWLAYRANKMALQEAEAMGEAGCVADIERLTRRRGGR